MLTIPLSPTPADLQAAIDRAAAENRWLYFPPGEYRTTTLYLRDNSRLYLEEGAVLAAIPDPGAWTECRRRPLLYGEGLRGVRIRGKGTISCSGHAFTQENGERLPTDTRPELTLWLRDCRDLELSGITLTDTVGWTLHLDNCEDVYLEGLIIRNPPYHKRKNSDGIDLNGCRRVVVLHCDIETGDDAICLKNIDRTQPDRPRQEMRDIYVAHCRVASCCNGTKIGTETVGDVHHVTFRDIRVCRHSGITAQGAGEPPVDIRHTLAAISVQSNDGGAIHHITFADYRVEEVDAPLFLLHQRRERFRENPRGGALSHITVEGLQVEKAWRTSQILAQEGLEIGPVTLSGLQVRCFEEPKAQWDPRLPTGAEYPDVYNFGRFPAFGLYARGCTGLSIAGADWEDVENSGRPPVDLGTETEEVSCVR